MITTQRFPTPEAMQYHLASRMWCATCENMHMSDFIKSYEKVQRLSAKSRVANSKYFAKREARIMKRIRNRSKAL